MSQRCLGCMKTFGDAYDMCPHCGYVVGTPAQEPIHLAPGTRLYDRYLVGKVLGYGGFGITYIGWDEVLSQRVAIREYLPGEFSTRMPGQTGVTVFNGEKQEQYTDGLKKFLEEARKLAKFQDEEGIVRIFDSFEENATAYIVMEYLEGETLSARLKEKGVLSEDDAIALLMPVMQSLQAVHARGLLHRDIAPENIFMTNDGKAKLIDFGASRYATTSHSRSLTVIIKQGYSPEEQYRSRGDQGPYTDVYALAATLYKMVTGQAPPDAMERRAKYEGENKDILIPPRKLNPKISRVCENALLNALNVRIEDRTPDIGQFIADLKSETPVRRISGRIRKLDVLRWPLWAKILVPACAGLFLVFGILLGTGVIDFDRYSQAIVIPDGVTVVPEVEGMAAEKAISEIELGQLLAVTAGTVESEYIQAGMIVLQEGIGGSYADMGSMVYLVVSSGGPVVAAKDGIATVPYVTWDTLSDAREKLKTAGLGTPVIEEAYDNNVSEGQIISQSIAAGEQVAEGTVLTLVVSKGPKPFAVPDVTGKPMAEAVTALRDLGLSVSVVYETSQSAAEGTVLRQSIASGEMAKRGDSLTLTVASREETVTVPDVTGRTQSDASAILADRGFAVSVLENYSDSVPAGTVIGQNPAGGSEQIRGSNVTLYVSLGPSPEVQEEATRQNQESPASNPETEEKTSGSTSETEKKTPAEETRSETKAETKAPDRQETDASSETKTPAADRGKETSKDKQETEEESWIWTERIWCEPDELSLRKGETASFKVCRYPENGMDTVIVETANTSWYDYTFDSDTMICTITAKDVSEGVPDPGDTLPTLIGFGCEYAACSCNIRIQAPTELPDNETQPAEEVPIQYIWVEPDRLNLKSGETASIQVYKYPENGTGNVIVDTVNPQHYDYSFDSSTMICTITAKDGTGGEMPDETIDSWISFLVEGTLYGGGCVIRIEPPAERPITNLSVNPSDIYLTSIGDSTTLMLEWGPFGATNTNQIEAVWDAGMIDLENLGNTGVVEREYRVTAQHFGDTVVTFWDPSHQYSARCSVHVVDPLWDIVLDRHEVNMKPGDVAYISASVPNYPDTTESLRAYSDNTDICTAVFDSGTGVCTVTAVNEGTCNIIFDTARRTTWVSCSIIVSSEESEYYQEPEAIIVTPTVVTIDQGTWGYVHVEVLPENTWIKDWSIAYISGYGDVFDHGAGFDGNDIGICGLKEGTGQFYVYSPDYGVQSEVVTIQVLGRVWPSSVSVDPTVVDVAVGETAEIYVAVWPENVTVPGWSPDYVSGGGDIFDYYVTDHSVVITGLREGTGQFCIYADPVCSEYITVQVHSPPEPEPEPVPEPEENPETG